MLSTRRKILVQPMHHRTRREGAVNMSQWFLEVTDLKQYACCPRIVFYRYCLPKVRPTTYLMEEGIRTHDEEDEREGRRSLRVYGFTQGERYSHLSLQS